MQRKALAVFAFVLVASTSWLLLNDWRVEQVRHDHDDEFVVMGRIEHRDRMITVKAGSQGTVYTVALKNGRILYENISADQLARRAPAIHDFIESATAAYAGMGRDLIDARK